MNYTVYHLHSDLSNGVTNIDSVTKFAEYVDYAKSLGMTALGFSEHGCIFEHIKKKETIEKSGMKYIHGEEFYLTESLETKQKDNYHVVIMAKNYDGFLELNKLSSIAFSRSSAQTCGADEHFYYVPRITMDELESVSDNLICTSACLGGVLNKGNEALKERFIQFLVAHKDNCFLEVQHHSNVRQVEYNKYLYGLSQRTGLRLIAGTDTHCLNETHARGRAILQKAKNINFADEEGWDLTFKTYDELVKCYEEQGALPQDVYLQAIENTNLLPDMVTPWEIDRSYKYPHLWENPEKLFLQKIKEGIDHRGIKSLPNYNEYRERILYEIEGYKHNGAVDFMLLMTDIADWCKAHDILLGYGRGSVNGSVIAWLLGITEMDAVKYNLNFERFMSKERVSLSDIDSDLPPSRREEVKDYLFAKDGLHCCDIITFNTIALRGAIRDVARALEIPLNKVDEICDLAEKDIEAAKEQYPELFEYVDIVNGTIVSVGTHPCLLAGTKVLTKEGYKNIEHITDDDFVFTHNNRYQKVNQVMTGKSDSWCNIRAYGCIDIHCTPNHPFLVKRKMSRQYKRQLGDNYSQAQWLPAIELRKGDAIAIPKNINSIIPKFTECNLPFEMEEFWWICGRYLGDGYTVETRRGKNWLQTSVYICHGYNDKTAYQIYDNLDKCGVEYTVKKSRTTKEITFKSKSVSEWLWYLKRFGKYAQGKKIPNEIYDLPQNLIIAFVDGYMSADGYKCGTQCEFSSVSKDLVLGMSLCINKAYNVHCTFKTVTPKEQTIEGRTVICKKLYTGRYTINPKNHLYFTDDKYIWTFVKSIAEYNDVVDTYNLSVIDDNSYTVNNIAVHNCGCVTSPFTIDDGFGLCTTATSSRPVSQIYMKEIDSLNYVKLDLLALDTIELINNTCKLIGIDRFTPDNIRFDDDKVWDSIRDDTTLIFQWESDSAQAYIKQLFSKETINKMAQNGAKVDKITLFSIGNGAIRPAGASYRNELAKGEVHKTGCLPIDEFLADTSGFLIFQCQIIGFLHKFCGFTMGEADIVRRGFAKKTGTDQFIPVIVNGGYIKDGNTHYIKGFIQTMKDEYGMEREEAEKTIVDFIKVIEDASSYLFSLNHSQPYSMEGYVSGYLRYYYPLEFLTTAFNIHEGDEDKTSKITEYANKRGVKISPIKFRHSSDSYTCDKSTNTIYKSVSSVKYLNSAVANALYDMRDQHFDSFIDFLKVNPCNTRQTEILIRLDFFSEFGKSAKLLTIHDLFQKFFSRKDGGYVSKKSIKKTAIEPFSIERLNQLCTKETATAYQFDDLTPLIAEYASTINDEDITPVEKIEAQLEYLGYIAATGLESDRRIGYVRAVYPCKRKSDNKTWAYKVSVTFLGKGKDTDLTIYKARYDKCKLQKGDIFYANSVSPKDYQGRRYWYLMEYKKI